MFNTNTPDEWPTGQLEWHGDSHGAHHNRCDEHTSAVKLTNSEFGAFSALLDRRIDTENVWRTIAKGEKGHA